MKNNLDQLPLKDSLCFTCKHRFSAFDRIGSTGGARISLCLKSNQPLFDFMQACNHYEEGFYDILAKTTDGKIQKL